MRTGDATDATLSALSVSGATLSPAFDAATTSYLAVVANSVSQVTITATTSESTATVEYLDNSDATRTDADTMTAGLQVNLSVGSNIVKVKVTAPDTTTTETYTVNVFRVAVPVACSPASMHEPDLDGKPDRGDTMVASVTIYGFNLGLQIYLRQPRQHDVQLRRDQLHHSSRSIRRPVANFSSRS